jgi:hypothetical protein
MMRQPFPLQWPAGWARTEPDKRERALFRVTLTEGIHDLLDELRLMGAANVVITSNLPTGSKGLPYANGKADDTGVAVWCVIDGVERVFPCDRWTTAAANLRAIGKTVEAIRKIGDWGAADLVTRAFSGFAALPPGSTAVAPNPGSNPKRPWREVFQALGSASDIFDSVIPDRHRGLVLKIVRERHREAMRKAHPDAGGTHERALELNVALQEAEAELGGV